MTRCIARFHGGSQISQFWHVIKLKFSFVGVHAHKQFELGKLCFNTNPFDVIHFLYFFHTRSCWVCFCLHCKYAVYVNLENAPFHNVTREFRNISKLPGCNGTALALIFVNCVVDDLQVQKTYRKSELEWMSNASCKQWVRETKCPMPIHAAAAEFDIPYPTLRKHIIKGSATKLLGRFRRTFSNGITRPVSCLWHGWSSYSAWPFTVSVRYSLISHQLDSVVHHESLTYQALK